MIDEEKKPRHRLTADEVLEETNAAVGKIITLLMSKGLEDQSVTHLRSLAKANDFMVRYIIPPYPFSYDNQLRNSRAISVQYMMRQDGHHGPTPFCGVGYA